MTTWSTPVEVLLVWRTVWVAPETVGVVVPTAPPTSKIGSPTTLLVVREGLVPVPMALPMVPSGVTWLTPVNDIEVAASAVGIAAVTTTLCAPAGGAVRYQSALRTVPFVDEP